MSENAFYELQVREQLDEHWSEWFEDLSLIHSPDGSTVLTGLVADGAALFGLLDRVRDLGLTLLSVRRLDPGEAAQAGFEGVESSEYTEGRWIGER